MSLLRFQHSTEIDRPSGEVFRWHERPGALERLLPPWEKVQLVSSSYGITDGNRVTLRQKVAGVWTEWEVEHRGYFEGREFRDVAIRGPFSQWEHIHRVVPKGTGSCRLDDLISYALPAGLLGRAVASGKVKRELERMFAFRESRMVADLTAAAQYGAVRPMQILVSGGSGLVGSALIPFLRSQGHEVLRLVRHQPRSAAEIFWDPAKGELDLHRHKTIDAVVHLAGANVGQRWTAKARQAIWNSRVQGTHTLVSAIEQMRHRPFVFVSASGVGFYGDAGETELDEHSPRGKGFLADVCDAWEHEAEAVDELGIRPVFLRTGTVLTPAGGALARLLPLFRSGLGGSLGSGRQWMSWISIDDLVGAYYHAILDQRCRHEVNAVAPEPVTNREFSKTLASVLGRPALVPAPAFALRAALGEMADELLLASQRVHPTVLGDSGYKFRHPTLESALRFVLGAQRAKREG